MGTREVFDYYVCGECGSAYIKEFPANIAKYYEGYYSFKDQPPTIERSKLKQAAVAVYANTVVRFGLSAKLRQLFRCPNPWQMKFVSPNLQAFLFLGAKANARILDVGSGNGEFVRMMRRFGYRNAFGIDPFLDTAAHYANVTRADIFSVEATYDVILFNHSLEHMAEPEAALKKCHQALTPKGTIIVQVPNMDAREFKRFKQHWCWLHAPYHYAIPSRAGLNAMATRCGFRVTDAVCTSRPDHYLYSEEYSRDIGDTDPISARRKLESGTFDCRKYALLGNLAYSFNKDLAGDWIAYYLVKN